MELPATGEQSAEHDQAATDDQDNATANEQNSDIFRPRDGEDREHASVDSEQESGAEPRPSFEESIQQPDLQSDEEAALALQEELELAATVETAPEHLDEEEHHQTSEREEPETREDRMLPSVAAE